MKSNSKKKGNRGEDIAVQYLKNRNYKVIERNFRSRRGEVDIIAVRDDVLVFVEVKAWSFYGKSSMEYAINWQKQEKIIHAANVFLLKNEKWDNYHKRFDLCFIDPAQDAIDYITDAFQE